MTAMATPVAPVGSGSVVRTDRRAMVASAASLSAAQGIPVPVAADVLHRFTSGSYERWRDRLRGAGFCQRPVRVTGRRVALHAGGGRELLYSTAGEPDRVLLLRCGNRRASACEPCSREYKGDVWHLLHAGTAGGSKGVPASVAAHPMWFATVTAPGFGAVHGDGCGRARGGRSASGGRTGSVLVTCPHGRPVSCPDRHAPDDPGRGEPVCPDCYDYPAAVAFNWVAPELWRRFTIGLRRRLAAHLDVPESRLRERLRVSYAKVAEFQRRGVVHFHAIIRLDGPGDDYARPAAGLHPEVVAGVIRAAAADVMVAVQLPGREPLHLGFGAQLDVRPIHQQPIPDAGQPAGDTAGGVVTSGMVAAYIAKYATKAAEDFGLDQRVRSTVPAVLAGLRPHIARMVLTADALNEHPGFDGIGRWLHMLGFRGHFTTKSRRFSVTLGALRQARADHQAQQHTDTAGPPATPTRRVISGDGATRRAVPTVPTSSEQRSEPASVTGPGPVNGLVGAVGRPPADATNNQDRDDQDAGNADQGDADDGGGTVVVGEWVFAGQGHTTAGDALLAAWAWADHQEALSLTRDARTETLG